MAKALFGHVGMGPDPRLVEELHRMRRRVQELEAEVVALREANAALAASVSVHDDMLAISVPDTAEAALT